MRIVELSGVGKKPLSNDLFIQPITASLSVEESAHFKASARKMRTESQSAQLRVERQMEAPEIDWEVPLNEENANRLLQYLDQMIEKSSAESSDFEVFIYTFSKLSLYVYLGDTAEVVACLKELNKWDGSLSEEREEPFIEGDLAHVLLDWAAEGIVDSVLELAKYPEPIVLLLLKAKGIPLPEPQAFSSDFSLLGEELSEYLYRRDYKSAIQWLDNYLKEGELSLDERDLPLQMRGFCKAMLGNYEEALRDYDEAEDCGDVEEISTLRGLIHFLNNDPEKARAELWPPCKAGTNFSEYRRDFLLRGGDFAGFAIAKILFQN